MLLSTCGVPQICIWGPHIVVLCLVDEMIDEGVGRTQREWWLTRPGSMACCWPGDPDAPTGLASSVAKARFRSLCILDFWKGMFNI